MRALPLLLPLLGCQDPARDPGHEGQNQDDEQFVGAVRIRSPADGASVQAPFSLRFSTDDSVWSVRVELDGQVASQMIDADEAQVQVDADPGRHKLTLVGFDREGQPLAEDELDLRVLAPDADEWVTFFTPATDTSVVSPVPILVQASDGVSAVEIFANGRSLGEWTPDTIAWSDLGGASGAVTLRAEALSENGGTLAEDELELSVSQASDPGPSDFNGLLLNLIDTYPDDGTYTYYWPSGTSWSGSTRDIYYQDALVADDGGFSSCYCSGITWELYLRAWREWDLAQGGDGEDINGLSASQLKTLRGDWYVRELDGPGPNVAMEGGGLGLTVPSVDDWRPGDIIQFWRTSGSGHTVVFIDWALNEAGEREGFDYVSCQGATDGFGLNRERFGVHSGAIDPLKTYAGRALMPADWY